MIYQVFHHPDLLASCDLASPRNRPIGVGPAVEFCRERGLLHDAAGGPSITEENARLNEWTAIYWLWKNLDTLDDRDSWIGLSHYRRPAPGFIRASDVDVVPTMLREADLIAWVPNISSIYGQAREPHPGMIDAAVAAIAFVHGKAAGEAALRAVQVGTIHAFSNCFLMTKERFRHYAAWCWAAINGLLELERGGNAHLVPFDLTKPRHLGFLAERLLPIYVLVHELHGTYLFRT